MEILRFNCFYSADGLWTGHLLFCCWFSEHNSCFENVNLDGERPYSEYEYIRNHREGKIIHDNSYTEQIESDRQVFAQTEDERIGDGKILGCLCTGQS